MVLAGGLGRRMGRPKQFIELLGAPALSYTLRAFELAPSVEYIYVVGDRERVEELALERGIGKYAGCASAAEARSLSTRSGLNILDGGPEDLVLVHDGSRCLITAALIERVVRAASAGVQGVVPALPVSDTIKVASEGVVMETLDRTMLWAVQTPQAFRLGLLRQIFAASDDALMRATDDASLVEELGGKVVLVEGDRTNIKLTTPEDLIFAEAILKSRLQEGD